MTNDATRANGEAMPPTNRRTASAPTGAGDADMRAMMNAAHAQDLSEKRIKAALAELKAALAERHPDCNIEVNRVVPEDDGDHREAILAYAIDPTRKNSGGNTLKVEPTEEEFAALEFEPWVHTEGEFVPPTNAEWCAAANPTLISIRLAWLSLYKTKSELVEMMTEFSNMPGETDDPDNPMILDFVRRIEEAAARIEQLHEVLQCARGRIWSAALCVEAAS